MLLVSGSLRNDENLRQQISEIVELPVTGRTEVINLIQIFQRIGIDAITSRAKVDLSDYKPACYYGCMLTRPADIVRFDDPEQPTSMENMLKALGAQPVDWNYKTECCGAGMTIANDGTVINLSHKILANAEAHGANCVVVACPMCHVNLDMKQSAIEHAKNSKHGLAIYYLSDLIGLALGVEAKQLGISRHFVVKSIKE